MDRAVPDRARVLGLVLAGGASSRMGVDKALVPVEGEPLVARVAGRLSGQCGAVAVAAGADTARIAALGLTALPDAATARLGPLAGIAAGLAHAQARGFQAVLTAPCDAPFCPPDLLDRLSRAIGEAGVAAVEGPHGLEPLFALWRVGARPAVEAALADGRLAVRQAMEAAGMAVLAVGEAEAAAFANLNTPEDFARSGLRPA